MVERRGVRRLRRSGAPNRENEMDGRSLTAKSVLIGMGVPIKRRTRQLRRRLYLGNAGPMPYLKIPKCPEGSEPITYGPCCYQLERGLKQYSFVTPQPHYH